MFFSGARNARPPSALKAGRSFLRAELAVLVRDHGRALVFERHQIIVVLLFGERTHLRLFLFCHRAPPQRFVALSMAHPPPFYKRVAFFAYGIGTARHRPPRVYRTDRRAARHKLPRVRHKKTAPRSGRGV